MILGEYLSFFTISIVVEIKFQIENFPHFESKEKEIIYTVKRFNQPLESHW